MSSDGELLALTFDRGVGVLDAGTLQLLARESTPVKGMYGLAFSPDRALLATASADGRVRVWDVSALV